MVVACGGVNDGSCRLKQACFLRVPSLCMHMIRRFYKNGEWQEVVTDTRIPCAHPSKSNVRGWLRISAKCCPQLVLRLLCTT